MIKKCERADEAFVLAKAQAATGLGTGLLADWALLCENPALPHLFFRVGPSALLEHTPTGATLLATPENPEELNDFLALTGVDEMTTDGFVPAGWAARRLHLLVWDEHTGKMPPSVPHGTRLETAPPPADVMTVLQGAGSLAPAAKDAVYAELCVRLAHGFAEAAVLYGPNGLPLSCAVAHSHTPAAATLAGVATLPTARGKGYARALVAHLCQKYRGKAVHLLCEAPLLGWYQHLGFGEVEPPVFRVHIGKQALATAAVTRRIIKHPPSKPTGGSHDRTVL